MLGKLIQDLQDEELTVREAALLQLTTSGLLKDGSLVGQNLENTKFLNATLYESILTKGRLSYANFIGTSVRHSNFDEAILIQVDFGNSKLEDTSFAKASMEWISFYDSIIRTTTFSESDLSNSDFSSTVIQYSNFENADMRFADLSESILMSNSFKNANFENAICNKTIFADIDFRQINGLSSVRHLGPSTIGLDSIMKSQGQIPESFLKGAGIPDSLISVIHGLHNKYETPIYCTLCYSVLDQEIATKIQTSLLANGIHAWLADNGAEEGDQAEIISYLITQSRDNTILIASEASLTSWWIGSKLKLLVDDPYWGTYEGLIVVDTDGTLELYQDVFPHTLKYTQIDFMRWKISTNFNQSVDLLIKALQASYKK